jgi:hypothetical protein
MKRLLTCVAIVMAVCVVVGLIARERSILRAAEERARRAEATARHALERARQASPATAPAEVFAPRQSEPVLSAAQFAEEPEPVFEFPGQVDPLNGLEALRQKYVEQQAVKALLMQSEELESALDTTNREIRELDAQQRLKGASETLEEIVAECEGTQAAPVAARMLELYRNPEPAAEAASEAAAVEVPSEATEPFAEPEFNPEPGI